MPSVVRRWVRKLFISAGSAAPRSAFAVPELASPSRKRDAREQLSVPQMQLYELWQRQRHKLLRHLQTQLAARVRASRSGEERAEFDEVNEIADGVTLEEVREQTGCAFRVADPLAPMLQ